MVRGARAEGAGRVAASGLAAAALVALAGVAAKAPVATAADPRPNVVLITSDDQPPETLALMERTLALVRDRGASFERSFANFPLCCPARATLLTGRYAHNHGVLANSGPDGGYRALAHRRTLPVALQRAGYRTAMIGRYLNGYGPIGRKGRVPAGWSRWFARIAGVYYGTAWNANGRIVSLGNRARDNLSAVVNRRAPAAVRGMARRAAPFFLWVSHLAPHASPPSEPGTTPEDGCNGRARPTLANATAFPDAPLPTPPSFNEADVSDKPSPIAGRPPLDNEAIAMLETSYRCQLRSLLDVDRGVERIVRALRRTGELRRTYIIFTTDNGYLRGEHRVSGGKLFPYEPSLRLPLLVRGPGVEPGTTVEEPVTNADLATTIARLAGVRLPRRPDGRSLLPALRAPARERGRELLIESRLGPDGSLPLLGIRNRRYMYAEYENGERELYDMRSDPHQLLNVAADPAYADAAAALADRLAQLAECAGESCSRLARVGLAARRIERPPRGCDGDRVRLAIVGGERGAITRARVRLGRREWTLTSAPFAVEVPSPARRARASATIDLVDGRRREDLRAVPRCR